MPLATLSGQGILSLAMPSTPEFKSYQTAQEIASFLNVTPRTVYLPHASPFTLPITLI